MKKKLTKYDFFAINRLLNQNFNKRGFCGLPTKAIEHGEELKLNYKEQIKRGLNNGRNCEINN